jgi:hypothetical protein
MSILRVTVGGFVGFADNVNIGLSLLPKEDQKRKESDERGRDQGRKSSKVCSGEGFEGCGEIII